MTTETHTQHTTGPWRAVEDGGQVRIFGPRLSDRDWQGVTVVANINGHFAKPGTDLRAEHMANASLITHAPDLLQVAQGALGYLEALPPEYRPDEKWLDPLRDAINAALA